MYRIKSSSQLGPTDSGSHITDRKRHFRDHSNTSSKL